MDGKAFGGASRTSYRFAVPDAADWYAVSPDEQGVELRSQTTGELVKVLKGFRGRASALVASRSGHLLLAGSTDGSIACWNGPADGDAQPQVAETGPGAVAALAFAPNEALALSAHAYGRLCVWHVPLLRAGKTYIPALDYPRSVVFRPQLDCFAAGFEKPDIGLWSMSDVAGEAKLLRGHTAAVHATVITPDGSLLISGSDDKTIRLWSLPEGGPLRSLVDLTDNYETVRGTDYQGKDVYGRIVTFTLPCGSPMPAGAVCTCNCVPGSMPVPPKHARNLNSSGLCTCDLICTCNAVCTCQSTGGSGRGGGYRSYWYPN